MLNPNSSLAALLAAAMPPGRVVWIGLRPARREPMTVVPSVIAEAGKGLAGDRYKTGAGRGPLWRWKATDVLSGFKYIHPLITAAEQGKAGVSRAPGHRGTMAATAGSNKRIVIADDHTLFRLALKALVERAGYEVVGQAANGQEALAAVAEHHPALVLLDLSMPVLNGIDAGREIRRRFPQTRVLLVTMCEDEVYVDEALKAGIDGFVLKTQASSELMKAMRKVLEDDRYVSPSLAWVGQEEEE